MNNPQDLDTYLSISTRQRYQNREVEKLAQSYKIAMKEQPDCRGVYTLVIEGDRLRSVDENDPNAVNILDDLLDEFLI